MVGSQEPVDGRRSEEEHEGYADNVRAGNVPTGKEALYMMRLGQAYLSPSVHGALHGSYVDSK